MKCIYHMSDFDGVCSAAIIKLIHPECIMLPIDRGYDFDWGLIEKDEEVYMVDYSFDLEDMKKLNELTTLHWFDHHISAIEEVKRTGFVASGSMVLDTSSSACKLVYDSLLDGMYISDKTIDCISDWDTGDRNSEAKYFQYGLRSTVGSMDYDNDVWNKLIIVGDEDCFDEIIEQGKLICRFMEETNARMAKSYSFVTEFEGLNALCINTSIGGSEVFESIYDPEIHDIMILYRYNKFGTWGYSLRSDKDEVDCAEIASRFGGGGHKGAAGFGSNDLLIKI